MLKVHVNNLGAVAVLRLQGRMVNGEAEVLHNALDRVSDNGAVILDLACVTTVDARGLGVMLELREQAQAKGIRFELMNVSQMVRKVLELARLDSVFKITSMVELFPAVSHRQRAPVALASCA